MRASSSNKVAPRMERANRSPSPDFSNHHHLEYTKRVIIKEPETRVPMDSTQSIKSRILNMGSSDNQKEQEEMQRRTVNNSVNTKSKKKLTMTTTILDQYPAVPRKSVDKRRVLSAVEERGDESSDLNEKVKSLTRENEELRKCLFSNPLVVPDPSTSAPDLSRIKSQLKTDMRKQMQRFETNIYHKMRELEQQGKKGETSTRQNPQNTSKSRKNSRQSSIIEEESTPARANMSYRTPQQVTSRYDEVISTPFEFNAESEKIIELQKQNEDLTKENFHYKEAYDELIRKQGYGGEFSANSFRKSGEKLRDSSTQIESLVKENAELRLKNKGLEKSFIEVKLNLEKNIRVTQSINQLSPNEKDLTSIIQQKDQEIRRLQKIINKDILDIQNNSNQGLHSRINQLSLQNSRLKEQITHPDQIISSRVHLVGDYETKKIKDLTDRNTQLEQELLKFRNEANDYVDKMVEIKEQEIRGLKEQVQGLREELWRGSSEESERLTELRQALAQANTKIQSSQRLNYLNRQQLQSSLHGLQQLRQLVQNIKFSHAKEGFGELGTRYKSLLNQKIEILKQMNNQTYEIHRLNVENDKNKLEIVEFSMKYTNERHNRERMQFMLEEQGREVESLNQQINSLNSIIREYVERQGEGKRLMSEGSEKAVTQEDVEGMEQAAENGVRELRQLEKQFIVVSSKITEIASRINWSLNETGRRSGGTEIGNGVRIN